MNFLHFTLFVLSLMNAFGSSLKYGNKRFDEWTWLTAHNSQTNKKDSGVDFYLQDQDFDLETQLKNGVRGFMFDLTEKKCSNLEKILKICKCEGICVGHGEISDLEKLSKNMENLSQENITLQLLPFVQHGDEVKPFKYFLQKIVTFLKKNRNEIVTIFLENYVKNVTSLQNVFNKIKFLNSLVFNPYSKEWSVSSKGWPKIEKMITDDKRLLIIEQTQRYQNENPNYSGKSTGIINAKDFCIENNWKWTSDEYTWDNFNIQAYAAEYRSLFLNYFDGKNLHMKMSKCSSREDFQTPDWKVENPLNLSKKEDSKQISNQKTLFIFNHFIGVRAYTIKESITGILMNDKNFILKRIKEKCDPATNGKKPNFIALDFIDKNVYKDLIEPLNRDQLP